MINYIRYDRSNAILLRLQRVDMRQEVTRHVTKPILLMAHVPPVMVTVVDEYLQYAYLALII